MPSSSYGAFVVYAAALAQGLTVVAFPASGTVLRQMHELSNEAYGSIFLPQTVLTIVGSLIGGVLARRIGLQSLLILACMAAAVAQALLLATSWFSSELALPLLLAGTAAMGLGFGLAAAPLNTYPGRLFPARADTALVALHSVMGAGFSLGPLAVGALVAAGVWASFPTLVLVINALLAMAVWVTALPEDDAEGAQATPPAPLRWSVIVGFGVVAVLYAVAEGTFSNWASIFLHEARGVAEPVAALALSGFWGALTVGRLVFSALVARIKAEIIWLSLPVGMVVTFLVLPFADGAAVGIALFVLAGFFCSAFFPLTVAIATKWFPGREALVSSMLIAALMIGVGVGSFVLGTLRASASFDVIYRASAVYPTVALVIGLLLVVFGRPQRLGVRTKEPRSSLRAQPER